LETAHLVNWTDIQHNIPPNLKVSPLAAVPHKSRQFRAILDLSFQIRMAGLKLPSINATTKPHANPAAMRQLGQTLPWLIWAMATAAPKHDPIFFSKWDIKDGFWHLVVSPDNAWHFCYVLPGNDGEPIQLVVPTSLQMGWCESPVFFCTASETARDLAQELATQTQELPTHPLEHLCLPPSRMLPKISATNIDALKNYSKYTWTISSACSKHQQKHNSSTPPEQCFTPSTAPSHHQPPPPLRMNR